MKTSRLIFSFLLAGLLLSSAARADTFSTAIGGGVGAMAGAVLGDSMGGRNGAIIGSGVGGAVGAVVGQSVGQPRPSYQTVYPAPYYGGYERREVHYYHHEDRRHPGRGHAWGHYKKHHDHHGRHHH